MDAEALDDFCDALTRLLDSLTGSARLEPVVGLEGLGIFAITITLDHGKGEIEGFLAAEFHEARLTFAGTRSTSRTFKRHDASSNPCST